MATHLVPCTDCGQWQRVRIVGNIRGQGQDGDITAMTDTPMGLRYVVSLHGDVLTHASVRDLQVISLCGGFGGKPGVCAKGKDVARKEAPGAKGKDDKAAPATASGNEAKKPAAYTPRTAAQADATQAEQQRVYKAGLPPGPAPTSQTPPADFLADVGAAFYNTGEARPGNKTYARVHGVSEDKSRVNVQDRHNQSHTYTHIGNGQWVHNGGTAADPKAAAWLTAVVQSGGKTGPGYDAAATAKRAADFKANPFGIKELPEERRAKERDAAKAAAAAGKK